MNRRAIAAQTITILEKGEYETPNGANVSLAHSLAACLSATRCYDPDSLAALRDQVIATPSPYPETTFEVISETTLEGCARLVAAGRYTRVGALNFASARNAGGGFLSGAQAQEESLARSSGLYPSLRRCPDYYAYHRHHAAALYSDRMIYSPACPVFRRDDGTLLEQPYAVDFITSPAPNAGAIRHNEPESIPAIPAVLHERAGKVLALAASQNIPTLVLGAWGCGVFQNDPLMVATTFHHHLTQGGAFWGRFAHIRFSIYDRGGAMLATFREQFAAYSKIQGD
ncbi:MAG TPA: TIGR02452 family protein [Aggregatilineales bacterium]|nr:TIGR02452 family protein [Anaerolineales bacterium]HRE46925.1 TIGR02452 family protein [Aggregatilineales bacterium]